MLTAKDNGHGAEVFENGERVGVTTAKLLGVPTDGRPVEADAFVLGTANIIEIRRIEGAWCEVAFSGHAELRSHIQVEAEFGPAPQVEGETRRYAIVPLAEPQNEGETVPTTSVNVTAPKFPKNDHCESLVLQFDDQEFWVGRVPPEEMPDDHSEAAGRIGGEAAMNDENPAKLTAHQQIIVITLRKIMEAIRYGRASEAKRLLDQFWDHQRATEIEDILHRLLAHIDAQAAEITRLQSIHETNAHEASSLIQRRLREEHGIEDHEINNTLCAMVLAIEMSFRQMRDRGDELTRLRSLLPTTADGVSIADCSELYCPHCGDKVLQYPACCVCENCGTDESGTMELEYSETVSKPKETA